MGLSNGIMLKNVMDIATIRETTPRNVSLRYYPSYEHRIEVWCWIENRDVKYKMLDILHDHFEDSAHKYVIKVEDIPTIIEALGTDDNQLIRNLNWLQEFLPAHPEVKCYFYDEY